MAKAQSTPQAIPEAMSPPAAPPPQNHSSSCEWHLVLPGLLKRGQGSMFGLSPDPFDFFEIAGECQLLVLVPDRFAGHYDRRAFFAPVNHLHGFFAHEVNFKGLFLSF